MKIDLGKEKINKLLLSFAIPCVISMLINSIYNIVDQIFIGKGVGTLGNAATNVIFPLVIIANALAGLIGNGASANLSLKMGEGKKEDAKKSIGSSITLTLIVSVIFSVLSYLFLSKLVYFFGCTQNVYKYAMDYGRIILVGTPFVIMYTAISSIIRADGSPRYSMILLLVGAILNIILDPIFIFVFNMGVKGGAWATVIGQVVSFILAILYIPKMKSIKLQKKDFKLDKSIKRVLSLGLSSFITQLTILVLFIFMNNIMTKYGALTKYGADIPLSVYGVISKLNSIYISIVLGVSIGSQPIIGYNYGAGNNTRVKETLKKVLLINFGVGIFFNLLILLIPKLLVGIFISTSDTNYNLFMEFSVLVCHSFLLLCSLNALEMTTSIVLQSLGKVKKATAVSFIRQIILFIPISLLFTLVFNKGIYGTLYAGALADCLCFIVSIFIFKSEYKKLEQKETILENTDENIVKNNYSGEKIVITIAREYGSGGHYIGKLLALKLGIPFYDKEIVRLSALESGLSEDYIKKIDQNISSGKYFNNNDDRLFLTESKIIKDLAKSSCIIVGRCADYILKNEKNIFKIFLYTSDHDKIDRGIKFYGLKKKNALKEIEKINKARAKHYKFYTDNDWNDVSNYDVALNVSKYGADKTVEILSQLVDKVNVKTK